MANQVLNQNGTTGITVGGLSITAQLAANWVPTGSNAEALNLLINTGSLQQITHSITDVGVIFIDNYAGPGTLQFYSSSNPPRTGSASSLGQQEIATCQPGRYSWMNHTGSKPLFGHALDSASYVTIYIIPN